MLLDGSSLRPRRACGLKGRGGLRAVILTSGQLALTSKAETAFQGR
jgi:hypothetical protein